MKKVLIKDIAKKAGVSTALVSYVLNGKEKDARISPKTAKRIREIAKELDYRPNIVAQSLRSGKSYLITIIVADISNPFFGQLIRLLEIEANKFGYNVIVGSSDEDSTKSFKILKSLVQRQTDGVILVPTEGSEEQLNYLNDLNIPFVLIDRFFEKVKSDYVIIDNFKSTYLPIKSLIGSGKKNIAYVRYDNQMKNTVERFNGYKKAIEESGLKLNEKLICELSYRDTERVFKEKFTKFLKKNPEIDSIMFSTNTLSLRGLVTLKSLHIKIPDQISVFCFDQNESYELFYYPINYVHQPLDKIAGKAMKILMQRIEGDVQPPVKQIVEPKIIFKEELENI